MARIALVANTEWYLYRFRLALAEFLRDQGHTVVLISPPGPYAARLQSAGFEWHGWPVGRDSTQPAGELLALLRLRGLYRSIQPDLAHHFTVKPVLYGTLAARSCALPAVVNAITGRGYIFLNQGAAGALLRAFTRPLYRAVLRGPRQTPVFENEADRDFFAGQGLVDPTRAAVIPGVGVDTRLFSPGDSALRRDGPPLVVFPARMLYDKGVDTLVAAARQLRAVGRPLRLALVGGLDPGNPSGLAEGQLREWEREGLAEWWGFREEMVDIFRAADIVCLPSLGEGLPTVLIEAAACARAIVATDVPGCREVVVDGETGRLVPPGDPAALAAALDALAAAPDLREQMGRAGRERVLAHFSAPLIHRLTVEVYRGLLPAKFAR